MCESDYLSVVILARHEPVLSYSHAQSIIEQAAPDKYKRILVSFCWQIACEQMVELSDLVSFFLFCLLKQSDLKPVE